MNIDDSIYWDVGRIVDDKFGIVIGVRVYSGVSDEVVSGDDEGFEF